MLCKICHGGARTVPARCPHGARYGARTVPAGKTRIIAQRAIELILVSTMLLIPSRQVREFPFFCSGHRVGTVWAPCGHRVGTERAPIGRSKSEGRGKWKSDTPLENAPSSRPTSHALSQRKLLAPLDKLSSQVPYENWRASPSFCLSLKARIPHDSG